MSCEVCSAPASKQCVKCRKVRYCSRSCQLSHWKNGHKAMCPMLAAGHSAKMAETFSSPENFKKELDATYEGATDNSKALAMMFSKLGLNDMFNPFTAAGKSYSFADASAAFVDWEGGDVGWEHAGGRGGQVVCKVATRARALREALDIEASIYLHDLPAVLRGAAPWRKDDSNGYGAWGDFVARARPAWRSREVIERRMALRELVRTRIGAYAAARPTFDASLCRALPDGEFLAALGSARDFKAGCAICQSDAMMGTACTCGHTEIVCFRPCGHTMCASPCFIRMCASEDRKARPLSMTLGQVLRKSLFKNMAMEHNFRGTSLESPGPVVAPVTDPAVAVGLSCPLCRVTIEGAFNVELAEISAATIGADVSQLDPRLLA